MKPTIIDKICTDGECLINHPKALRQIFSPDTSRRIMDALVAVANTDDNADKVSVP